MDTEGGYIPIYRDIVYRMNIADIEEVGSKTAFDAFKGEYFGNISASVETANLTDLSNKSSQIHVDQLDYTFVHVPESGKQLLMLTEDQAARLCEGRARSLHRLCVSSAGCRLRTCSYRHRGEW